MVELEVQVSAGSEMSNSDGESIHRTAYNPDETDMNNEVASHDTPIPAEETSRKLFHEDSEEVEKIALQVDEARAFLILLVSVSVGTLRWQGLWFFVYSSGVALLCYLSTIPLKSKRDRLGELGTWRQFFISRKAVMVLLYLFLWTRLFGSIHTLFSSDGTIGDSDNADTAEGTLFQLRSNEDEVVVTSATSKATVDLKNETSAIIIVRNSMTEGNMRSKKPRVAGAGRRTQSAGKVVREVKVLPREDSSVSGQATRDEVHTNTADDSVGSLLPGDQANHPEPIMEDDSVEKQCDFDLKTALGGASVFYEGVSDLQSTYDAESSKTIGPDSSEVIDEAKGADDQPIVPERADHDETDQVDETDQSDVAEYANQVLSQNSNPTGHANKMRQMSSNRIVKIIANPFKLLRKGSKISGSHVIMPWRKAVIDLTLYKETGSEPMKSIERRRRRRLDQWMIDALVETWNSNGLN